MIADDIVYLSLLFISVGCGSFIRNITDARKCQLVSTALGLILVFIVSGVHILHPLILTIVNALIVLYGNKRTCHVVSFIFCFGYLAFFRTTEYFGIPSPPAHTNAIQMILTLKMVGLAYEVNNHYVIAVKSDQATSPEVKYQKVDANFFDIIQYSFCFAGVLIGPYYKYKTYWDMFHAPYISHVPCNTFLKQRICVVPLYIVLFLLSGYAFPLEFASSVDMLKEPFWYRVFYMTPLFFNFRMRIYTGFVLGECVCISMGLGAYPVECNPQPGAGPTNYSALQAVENDPMKWATIAYNFEAIRNIDEYGSDFLPTIREGIRSWNRTVQYWLAMFVYRKTVASKPVKMVITMLVSAFWHGVHAGYYLCLLSAPLFLVAEMEVEKAFRKNVSPIQQVLFNWIWWVIKMQSFAYMGMAFLLLDIKHIFHYWKSIYFVGHVFIVVLYVIAFLKNKKRVDKKIKETQNSYVGLKSLKSS